MGIGACWRYASSERIALFRAAVAADKSGSALEELVVSLAADGHEIRGDVMSRVPRGYPAGHPRAAPLEHRSLIAGREIESEATHDVQPGLKIARFRPDRRAACPAYAGGRKVTGQDKPRVGRHGIPGPRRGARH
jgi:hypothetical protein